MTLLLAPPSLSFFFETKRSVRVFVFAKLIMILKNGLSNPTIFETSLLY